MLTINEIVTKPLASCLAPHVRYPYPLPLLTMLPEKKKQMLAAIKRLEGLTKKLHTMTEEDEYCTDLLKIALAMQGHIKHMQGLVLESHLHTCAPKKLASTKDQDAFIEELLSVIGLSTR